MEKKYWISITRLSSMLLIVACHVAQYYESPLDNWLNIGVQLFLCISGYLYGIRKEELDVYSFIKSRFIRLYIPYFLLLIFVLPLYFAFAPEYINLKEALLVFTSYHRIDGGGHLWYVPLIMLCYFLTPYYKSIVENILKKKRPLLSFLFIIAFQVLVFETFFSFFNSAWVNCYFVALVFGTIKRHNKILEIKYFRTIVIVCAIATNTFQFFIDYVLDIGLSGFALGCYHRFCNYSHAALGIALFLGMECLLSCKIIQSSVFRKILDIADAYSYEVYLTHQFFILGPLSLMKCTDSNILNYSIILVCICLSALILHWLSATIVCSLRNKGIR